MLDPADLSEEKVDPTLQEDLRDLTLEGKEEENGEVHQACEEKSLSEASEDTSAGVLNQDSTDSRPLQGVALGVEGPSPPLLTRVALMFWESTAELFLVKVVQ